MKFSFVILNYNKWSLVHQLLMDIYRKCAPVDEVLVVNNGCTEEDCFSGLDWWIEIGMLPVRELRIDENIGFLLGANEGLREANAEAVCLLSNDVRIHGDIVTQIKYQLSTTYKSMIGGRLLEWDTGWNTFGGKIHPYVEGWLLCTYQENWKELGYFDERYAPNDYEDLDLSSTAKLHKYMLYALPDGMVSHHGAQTISYGEEREALTKRNREKFKEKWNLK